MGQFLILFFLFVSSSVEVNKENTCIHLFMINSEEKEHVEFFCSVLFFFSFH